MRDVRGTYSTVLAHPRSGPVDTSVAGSIMSGFAKPEFAEVARSFDGLFGSRSGGGGALVVCWRGETVVDVWNGYADPAGERPWTRDTLSLSFSTSKGVASTVIHRLADRGEIDYDEPVASYWPEFAANGKGRITVREVLSHRAGLYDARALAPDATSLLDHLEMEDRLARAQRLPCAPAYHGLTYGWLLAGIARRVTGVGMAELVRSELAGPLGVDGLHIGAPQTAGAQIAQPIGAHPRLLFGVAANAGPTIRRIAPVGPLVDALLVPGLRDLLTGPEPRILQTEWASINGLFTADALATLYGALANRGETDDGGRLLSAATVRELGRVQTRARDRVMGLRVRWRLGYHQAVSIGARQPHAFGHYGYGGSGAWADPTTGLSLGFVTNKIGWQTTPIGDARLFRITGLALQAATGARP